MRIYHCLSLTLYPILLLRETVYAVSSGNLGPNLWDLNESASSDGNSHPAKHRSPRRASPSRQRSMSPSSSSHSVNNKDIVLKDSTPSGGETRGGPSVTRYSMRDNRARVNYADLQGSSSSEGSYAPPRTQATKRKSTDCKIHRPDCEHWELLDLKMRKQESKRYERSLLSTEEKQAIRREQTIRHKGSEKRAETRRIWERNRVARMKPAEKKQYLNRKAEIMRQVRARKRKIVKGKTQQLRIDKPERDSALEQGNKKPPKKMKSLSNLSKSEEERSTNAVDKPKSSK
ncbi:uncharacterized protein FA14DRAFT_49083 [Meira miltonrushii]|uniref:Uncharacterized protein n=1 Tax=Meira miltonrushii TaxID=1280837 RepID=A0A316VE58_9BASI|nr:uncharacterized protein FA14DRAFT_49083 [Meira miltonrushii]PWN35929.1 hypothetical protein FA14DRAFT_49083 [Meira miltonrushii]